jgi:hypothetical protein
MNAVPTFPFSFDVNKMNDTNAVSKFAETPELDVKLLLLKLTTTQRKELLAEMFRDDLKALVAAETSKGYQSGIAKLEQDFAIKQQQWLLTADQEASQTKAQLKSLLEGLQHLSLTIKCDAQPLLLEWCASAVAQVLRRELADRSYLSICLQELMQQSVARDGVVLCCAKADLDILQELLQELQQPIAVQIDPTLSVGDLKLVHGGTYLLSSVVDRLELLTDEIRALQAELS